MDRNVDMRSLQTIISECEEPLADMVLVNPSIAGMISYIRAHHEPIVTGEVRCIVVMLTWDSCMSAQQVDIITTLMREFHFEREVSGQDYVRMIKRFPRRERLWEALLM